MIAYIIGALFSLLTPLSAQASVIWVPLGMALGLKSPLFLGVVAVGFFAKFIALMSARPGVGLIRSLFAVIIMGCVSLAIAYSLLSFTVAPHVIGVQLAYKYMGIDYFSSNVVRIAFSLGWLLLSSFFHACIDFIIACLIIPGMPKKRLFGLLFIANLVGISAAAAALYHVVGAIAPGIL